jgi:hypothetical protein
LNFLPPPVLSIPHTIFNKSNNTLKMGYPETATGFLVNDQKNWTKFEKKEVH